MVSSLSSHPLFWKLTMSLRPTMGMEELYGYTPVIVVQNSPPVSNSTYLWSEGRQLPRRMASLGIGENSSRLRGRFGFRIGETELSSTSHRHSRNILSTIL